MSSARKREFLSLAESQKGQFMVGQSPGLKDPGSQRKCGSAGTADPHEACTHGGPDAFIWPAYLSMDYKMLFSGTKVVLPRRIRSDKGDEDAKRLARLSEGEIAGSDRAKD